MRAPTKLTIAILAAAALAACAKGSGTQASKDDDFKRDLQLASATNLDVATPAVNPALLTLETAPASAPKPAKVIKKAESGPAIVPSETPTVKAEVTEEVAAVAEQAAPVTTVEAPAPAPAPAESNEPVAVAPRPLPAPAGDYGRGGGGVYGGGVGVVIRGGGVGDGDHCEIRPRGGIIFRSPVYVPRMGGGAPSSQPTTPRIVRRG